MLTIIKMKKHCRKLLLVPLLGLGIGAIAQTKLVVANKNATDLHTSEAQVSIYDQTGRLVLTQPINALQMSLDISQLAQGLYVAKVATPNQRQTISFLKK